MKTIPKYHICFLVLTMIFSSCSKKQDSRVIVNFGNNWKFHPGEAEQAKNPDFNDSSWRMLDLPHDWSIEGKFSPDHPATPGGGALPGGTGWYRKAFTLDEEEKDKLFFIDFDGIYMNSEVWINGKLLGKRPNGYISFRYELTPYLNFRDTANILAVRVDNSKQPNSRWYSGSGIYRNVWLVKTNDIYVDHRGTFVTTPEVSEENATVSLITTVKNADESAKDIQLMTTIYGPEDNELDIKRTEVSIEAGEITDIEQVFDISDPELWSVGNPALHKAVTQIMADGKIWDEYNTDFGIRHFRFDSDLGFILNGEPVKILGVCNHHDLGCLGAAVNTRAIERQLEILKDMGCNGIRTSHNPPAPELLDLCDKMGFIVMDEMFDMWKKQKSEYDYSLYWDEWHERDLKDFILRDRNHPSVFIWSIGNEILEQWDSTGIELTRELYDIVSELDTTRPISAGCNPPAPENYLIRAGVLDLIGYNYHHEQYPGFHDIFPGGKFIGTETCSALATRGHYDMPSDSIRRWPYRWDLPFTDGNPGNTVSAYDNVSAPWGSTHRETWRVIKNFDFLSGMFIWTGFDYLGEPTPYWWPSRGSYFGVIDLAGFPKDSYYLYKSEWTDEDVLHVFPHWNWNEGDTIDVWAYTNCDEVELFLNGRSKGTNRIEGDKLNLMWRLVYEPGTIKAVGRRDGETIMTKEIRTAGEPAAIRLRADRDRITADGRDLSFITVDILDDQGNLVPYADNLVTFDLEGPGTIAGVDNGSQTSHEPFIAPYRKAFNGKCLAVIRSDGDPGTITINAGSEGLEGARLELTSEP